MQVRFKNRYLNALACSLFSFFRCMMPLFLFIFDILKCINSIYHILTLHSSVAICRGSSPSPHRCWSARWKKILWGARSENRTQACLTSPRNTNQCCGSMTFWCGSGSGSADQCLGLMPRTNGSRSGSGPAIFIIDLQGAKKNQMKKKLFCIFLFKGTLALFFKDKKSKRSHKTVEIKVFLTIFA